jgi:hypothetical protein
MITRQGGDGQGKVMRLMERIVIINKTEERGGGVRKQ